MSEFVLCVSHQTRVVIDIFCVNANETERCDETDDLHLLHPATKEDEKTNSRLIQIIRLYDPTCAAAATATAVAPAPGSIR